MRGARLASLSLFLTVSDSSTAPTRLRARAEVLVHTMSKTRDLPPPADFAPPHPIHCDVAILSRRSENVVPRELQ